MIDVETLTRLKTMRLSGMAEYFENLAATTTTAAMSGPELVKQAVDWEYERRRDSKLHRLRRQAGLAQPAADIADLKAMPGRSMDLEAVLWRRSIRVWSCWTWGRVGGVRNQSSMINNSTLTRWSRQRFLSPVRSAIVIRSNSSPAGRYSTLRYCWQALLPSAHAT